MNLLQRLAGLNIYGMDDDDLLRTIIHDESEPKLLRRRALEASVRHEEAWHPELVRRLWLDPDVGWRATAVFSMAFMPGFEREIAGAVENEALPVEIRREAFFAAAQRGLKQVRAKIRAMATDPKQPKEIRLAAVYAAAEYGPPSQARSLLQKVRTNDADAEIRQTAAEFLDDKDPDDFF